MVGTGARVTMALTASIGLVAASSAPIAPGNRKAFCRGEVAEMYGTKPVYVTTAKLLKARNGTTSVSGSVDKGSEGIKRFKCRFDAKGRFLDVMSLTPDGE